MYSVLSPLALLPYMLYYYYYYYYIIIIIIIIIITRIHRTLFKVKKLTTISSPASKDTPLPSSIGCLSLSLCVPLSMSLCSSPKLHWLSLSVLLSVPLCFATPLPSYPLPSAFHVSLFLAIFLYVSLSSSASLPFSLSVCLSLSAYLPSH